MSTYTPMILDKSCWAFKGKRILMGYKTLCNLCLETSIDRKKLFTDHLP